ncbi:MAG TPA: 3-oxoacyl-ACP reductase family protein [bacterium]|nr:3-oxoacyl-ACP reductase family protein [bacterium]
MTSQGLVDRVALVTGGARGIGLACASGLSRAGAAVVIADRLDREGEEAAQALRAHGGKAAFLTADLARTAEIPRVVREAHRAFGRIDVLVNNAGILNQTATEALSEDRWDRLMSINLKAVFFVTQAVLPLMVEQGGGSIVSISSLAARVGGIAAGIDYAASKAGVIGLTRTLARQYGPKGIRVNAVAPGVIATEMTRPWPEEVRQDFVTRTPLRRLGTPEDVARVVVFLAGPESAFITGTTIDVNGGLFMA